MQYLITPNIIATMACWLAAMWLLRHDPEPAWRIHRGYLALVLTVELAGRYLHHGLGQGNQWLYNGYQVVETLFIGGFLYALIRRLLPMDWRWWCIGLALFYGYYGYRAVTEGVLRFHHEVSYTLGIAVVCGCIHYFVLLMKQPPTGNLSRSAGFWWVYGTFFYYATGTVVSLFYPWFAQPDLKLWGLPLDRITQYVINFITYSLWTCSYYLRWRNRTKACTAPY